MNNRTYLFTSARLGFRTWTLADLPAMAAINADPEVMTYFPGVQSEEDTLAFIGRMQAQYGAKGFCYFAVERLDNGAFIGFTGLAVPGFAADFMPCIDIGWRLARKEWGQGFATEAATCCLDFAFEHLGINEVYAMAPAVNTRSEQVMKNIGMDKVKDFIHPLLFRYEGLRQCVLYRKQKAEV
jgi:RimJ/RimL family protein N-acetyltransferase